MEIAGSIRQLSTAQDGDLERLNGMLKKMKGDIRDMALDGDLLGTVTATLDSAAHTLGIMHLLAIQGEVLKEEDSQVFFAQAKALLLNCDPTQLRFAPKVFVKLAHQFTEVSSKVLNNPIQAIEPLLSGIAKQSMQYKSPLLTPIHTDLLQVCIASGCYHIGYEEFKRLPVYGVNVRATCISVVDFLKYFYYAGMACIGMKDFKEALECFKTVITTPAQALSAVVIASYKKYVLASLILHGDVPAHLPPQTASVVTRGLKQHCQTYASIVAVFRKDDMKALTDEIAKHTEELVNDSNLGLATQVVHALTRKRVKRLTSCYVTLSLEDMVALLNLESAAQAESVIVNMISSGDIYANIDQQSGMVTFKDPPADSGSVEMMQRLEAEMNQVVQLSKRIERIDIEVSKKPMYIMKARSINQISGVAGVDASGDFPVDPWQVP